MQNQQISDQKISNSVQCHVFYSRAGTKNYELKTKNFLNGVYGLLHIREDFLHSS